MGHRPRIKAKEWQGADKGSNGTGHPLSRRSSHSLSPWLLRPGPSPESSQLTATKPCLSLLDRESRGQAPCLPVNPARDMASTEQAFDGRGYCLVHPTPFLRPATKPRKSTRPGQSSEQGPSRHSLQPSGKRVQPGAPKAKEQR